MKKYPITFTSEAIVRCVCGGELEVKHEVSNYAAHEILVFPCVHCTGKLLWKAAEIASKELGDASSSEKSEGS